MSDFLLKGHKCQLKILEMKTQRSLMSDFLTEPRKCVRKTALQKMQMLKFLKTHCKKKLMFYKTSLRVAWEQNGTALSAGVNLRRCSGTS